MISRLQKQCMRLIHSISIHFRHFQITSKIDKFLIILLDHRYDQVLSPAFFHISLKCNTKTYKMITIRSNAETKQNQELKIMLAKIYETFH